MDPYSFLLINLFEMSMSYCLDLWSLTSISYSFGDMDAYMASCILEAPLVEKKFCGHLTFLKVTILVTQKHADMLQRSSLIVGLSPLIMPCSTLVHIVESRTSDRDIASNLYALVPSVMYCRVWYQVCNQLSPNTIWQPVRDI